ncbi:hypothetical protein EDB84DRAFT_43871 [Lactarius hengduanensis]|nr:hypothetical protein EDB84DRAFT_43871 [Lactarius hengduanensis]
MSAETFQTLQITAIALASLSGLFGVYFVLFILAVWSTYRQDTPSSKRLRWVTIILFLVLLIHFITRSLEFARARLQIDTDEELLEWIVPLRFLGNVTATFAALFSDGTLAWRFYIVFGRKKWALYLPAVAVGTNALLCWSADFQHLGVYASKDFYLNTLLPVTFDIAVAWGWFIFVNNTMMTGGILYKIVWANRVMGGLHKDGLRISTTRKYNTAIRAMIESAIVTWIGILILEITSLAPAGHVTTALDAGYVMLDVVPIFFGISQSLITARLGLTREMGNSDTNEYEFSQSQASAARNPEWRARFAESDSQGDLSEGKTVTVEFTSTTYVE